MKLALLSFPLQWELSEPMAAPVQARLGRLDWRRFQDGGSMVTIDVVLEGAAILASLADTNANRVGHSLDRTEAPILP